MASRQILSISNRLKLTKPARRSSWPWTGDPKRILVLCLPWLNAKDKHVRKYTDIYSDLGLDVLTMQSNVTDFLWPANSMKAGRDLIKVLEDQCQDYNHLCIHAMSVGAYNLTSLRMILQEEKSSRHLLDKIQGVIYDSVIVGAGKGGILKNSGEGRHVKESPSDALDLMVKGIAKSVTDNKIVFSVMNTFAKVYFALTKSQTLDFYSRAYDAVRDQPPNVPTLVFASKNDPVSDYKVMMQLVDIWRKEHSIPVRTKIWDKSGHAQHIVFHRDEYLDIHTQFFSDLFKTS